MSRRQDPFLDYESGPGRRPGDAAEPARARPPGEDGIPTLDELAELNAIGVDHDALLHSMVFLTRHHGNERSADSLLDGLPVDGLLNPNEAVRVMKAAGYNAGLIQRDIGDIPMLLLPAIVLLKNGDACVLVKRFDAEPGVSPMCEVVMPGPEFHACRASESELEIEYLGYALVATPQPVQAPGSGHREQQLLGRSGHWLWGTLRRFIPHYRSAMLNTSRS